jgi:hypothetical protein
MVLCAGAFALSLALALPAASFASLPTETHNNVVADDGQQPVFYFSNGYYPSCNYGYGCQSYYGYPSYNYGYQSYYPSYNYGYQSYYPSYNYCYPSYYGYGWCR